MFGLLRPRSRATLVRTELGKGFGHLRQAANLATSGVNAAVAPRLRAARALSAPMSARARDMVAGGWGSMAALLMPLATVSGRIRRAGPMPTHRREMSRMGALRRTMRGRRWPMAGLLVMGAAAGTAGVMILRRRRQGEWEAYDPAADVSVVRGGDGAAAADRQLAAAGHAAAGSVKSNGHASVTAKASAAVPSATADKGSGPATP